MEKEASLITVLVEIRKPIKSVWQFWTNPTDIMNWNFPFDKWHCPKAEND